MYCLFKCMKYLNKQSFTILDQEWNTLIFSFLKVKTVTIEQRNFIFFNFIHHQKFKVNTVTIE